MRKLSTNSTDFQMILVKCNDHHHTVLYVLYPESKKISWAQWYLRNLQWLLLICLGSFHNIWVVKSGIVHINYVHRRDWYVSTVWSPSMRWQGHTTLPWTRCSHVHHTHAHAHPHAHAHAHSHPQGRYACHLWYLQMLHTRRHTHCWYAHPSSHGHHLSNHNQEQENSIKSKCLYISSKSRRNRVNLQF